MSPAAKCYFLRNKSARDSAQVAEKDIHVI